MTDDYTSSPRLQYASDPANCDPGKRGAAIASVREAGDADINASGHHDQLLRQYGTLSICATALTIDNAWVALGGSFTVAVANGGPAGIVWEFVAACFYYIFIGASIAELASSIPSSGGVYHWSSVTAGRYGRPVGFFCGCINAFGWVFDLAAIAMIPANVSVQMYALFHPGIEVQPWHVFVTFCIITWGSCALVVFGNRLMPSLQNLGLFFVIVGGLVTIIVLAAMPEQHASAASVFIDFENVTGWSNGVAFLTGMLNGAFAIGTPDSVTHLAEELPDPRRDLPKAILFQLSTGFLTGFVFAVAAFFAVSDLDGVLSSSGNFPLAEIYSQATGNRGGTFGLLFIVLVSVLICTVGTVVTCGRIVWALARDNVLPFSSFFSRVDQRLSCPVPATVLVCLLTTGFGAITLGNATAFSSLVGSFIVLTTTSILLAVGPHLLSGRANVPKGPFWMRGWLGYAVNGLTVLIIAFTNVLYCFPSAYPTDVSTMNWNSVILVGCFAVTGVWWLVHGIRQYKGPMIPLPSGRRLANKGDI